MSPGSISRPITSGSGFLREMKRITVQSRKMMLTIIWNPTGFYQIVALPKGMKFNTDSYIFHLLDPFAEWQRSQTSHICQFVDIGLASLLKHTMKSLLQR
jgi:hypothetical protein